MTHLGHLVLASGKPVLQKQKHRHGFEPRTNLLNDVAVDDVDEVLVGGPFSVGRPLDDVVDAFA